MWRTFSEEGFHNFANEGLGSDGPFSNYNNPHFENEANCKTYLVELDINKKNQRLYKFPLEAFKQRFDCTPSKMAHCQRMDKNFLSDSNI